MVFSFNQLSANMILSRLTTIGNIRNLTCLLALKQVQSFVPAAIVSQPPALVLPCVQFRTVPTHGHNRTEAKSLKKFSTSPSVAVLEDNNEDVKAITEQIQTKFEQKDIGRLFAVIHIDGKQRKITAEDIIVLQKHIPAEIGEKIILNKVLMVGSKDFSLIGRPLLSSDVVRIEATVLEKTLSYTRVFFRYLRRQNNKKMRLQKDPLTYLRINAIRLNPLNNH